MTDIVRLHNVVLRTKVLGPGERAAIWFQGCKRSCKGCMSPSSRPLDGGMLASIPKICEAVLAQNGLEGVTISGGEPFLQPEALNSLLTYLREKKDLGVIIYTGYTIEQLSEKNDPHINNILNSLADTIIDGEYVEELNDGASLKGSSNQRVIHLTARYRSSQPLYEGTKRDVEVHLSAGEAFLIGIPNKETWRQWECALKDLNTEKRRVDSEVREMR